jgi:choline dehydrogenase-like flavoprotein
MSTLVRGERPGPTKAEKWLRGWAAALVVISLSFAVVYAVLGVFSKAEFPYAVNSVAKDVLLAGLASLVFWDVRRWASIGVPLIIAAHLVMPVMLLSTLHGREHHIDHTWLIQKNDPSMFRWTWLCLDILVASIFFISHRRAVRSRYDLRYLPPSAFRALMALAEVLVLREDREIAPAEVAVRVDHYLARFRAHQKYLIRLVFLGIAFLPLFTLHPPFHMMSVDLRQRWVQRRFLDETWDWFMPRVFRDLRLAMIRTAQQFCFFGYYGDERAAKKAGYVPFSQRPGYEEKLKRVNPHRRGVDCMDPGTIVGESESTNVVVVGTGAAGAILAYELAAAGHDVLMLERGPHVDPRTFSEDEAEQLSRLYADGALTLAANFRFQVAQGMCVGGGTVVNNAVCFDIPSHVLDRWQGQELEAGLDESRLAAAFLGVREFLGVAGLDQGARNPGAQYLVDAIDRAYPGRFTVNECNIKPDCLGSGYCNIGCAYGKKNSALDRTLPCVQQSFQGKVRILPDCRVEKVLTRDRRATGVRAKLADGRSLTVRADTVVLSAGAIASSIILQRSGLGQGRAGRGLSFNMASPVTLDFERVLHSERGAQMTHYLRPMDCKDEGVTLETWFNPIVTQSLFMPGWFEEHWKNMRRYPHMTCLGVVVGTESNATVKPTLIPGGVKLDYRPSDRDFVKLKRGVRLACEIGLEAGALRALPATMDVIEVTSKRELVRIDNEIGDDTQISINTSHPQGGNPMSKDSRKGVVSPEFKVWDTDDLFVCDASVFPSSINVNPQLTVMALAAYAAEEITGVPARLAPRPRQSEASISQLAALGPGS